MLYLHLQANPEGSHIPQSLLNLLILARPDWIYRHWTELWSSTLKWPSHLHTNLKLHHVALTKDCALYLLLNTNYVNLCHA